MNIYKVYQLDTTTGKDECTECNSQDQALALAAQEAKEDPSQYISVEASETIWQHSPLQGMCIQEKIAFIQGVQA